jgi:hypothetical protein
MESTARRVILPAILIVAGLAILVYGAGFRAVPVLVEQEEKAFERSPMPPSFMEEPSGPGAPPRFFEPPPPPPARKILVAEVDPEWRLIRDVTIGGLARLPSNEIRRTYSGEGPALCPT